MANLIRENIDRWFENNLDVDNRTLFMGSIKSTSDDYESGVDNFMAEYFIKGMHVLESRNKNAITIIMNNPGGDYLHGLAIYDAIKYASCHCTIKVYGHAMSMGSIILQAADNRILMPNSKFMIHYGYDGRNDHSKIVERWADEGKRLSYEMENTYLDVMLDKEEKMGHGYLAKHLSEIMTRQNAFGYPPPTPKSYSFSKVAAKKREEVRIVLKEMLNFDTILNAEETVALGFADEIYKNKDI
jgi:ATP-dependent protease ClpP protease subunit